MASELIIKPDNVIKKVLRASISDLICKGVKPKYYFISGSGNKTSFSKKNLQKISKSLKQGQNIEIRGFGPLSRKINKGQIVRNPKTKETKIISSRDVVLFKPSKEFKEFVNLKDNE